MNYIKGKYKNSIYTSESGYTVGLFRVKESDVEEDVQNKTITFTGFFPELNTEDTYLFYGKYIFHERYGYPAMAYRADSRQLLRAREAAYKCLPST